MLSGNVSTVLYELLNHNPIVSRCSTGTSYPSIPLRKNLSVQRWNTNTMQQPASSTTAAAITFGDTGSKLTDIAAIATVTGASSGTAASMTSTMTSSNELQGVVDVATSGHDDNGNSNPISSLDNIDIMGDSSMVNSAEQTSTAVLTTTKTDNMGPAKMKSMSVNTDTTTAATPIDDIYDEIDDDIIIEKALYRITAGLPKRELRSIIQETNSCEATLLEEIRVLEEALLSLQDSRNEDTTSNIPTGSIDKMEIEEDPLAVTTTATTATSTTATSSNFKNDGTKNKKMTINIDRMYDSPITPLDAFPTVSGLIGRLHNDIMSAAVPSMTTMNDSTSSTDTNVRRCTIPTDIIEVERSLEELTNTSSPLYKVYCETIVAIDILLTIWKKISINRAAFVFKRPVKSDEAPGYTDRIYFPMDLSLIRKRIITNNLQTYVEFHNALALISHNCVKYNGTKRLSVSCPDLFTFDVSLITSSLIFLTCNFIFGLFVHRKRERLWSCGTRF
jgi:Bromodomain